MSDSEMCCGTVHLELHEVNRMHRDHLLVSSIQVVGRSDMGFLIYTMGRFTGEVRRAAARRVRAGGAGGGAGAERGFIVGVRMRRCVAGNRERAGGHVRRADGDGGGGGDEDADGVDRLVGIGAGEARGRHQQPCSRA